MFKDILHYTAAPFRFVWSLFGFIFGLASRFTGRQRFKVEETVLFSVHRSFYMWGLIFLGWFVSMLLHRFPHQAGMWTWIYLIGLFYTFTLILFDLGTIKLVVLSFVVGFFILAAKYVESLHHVSMIGWLFKHFAQQYPIINSGVPYIISWFLFFPWLIALLESWRTGMKSFSPNGIEERHLLVGREITDRSGLHFVCKYPDLLEAILGFGAGTIVAYNNDNKVVKEWNHILGLYFAWDRLDEIIHQRSAVVDNSKNDPVEVEDSTRLH